MKHFSDEAWTDFARGVAAADKRAAMATHLSTGCPSCRVAVDYISQIQQVASLKPVPDEVVRSARAIFPQAAIQTGWIGALRSLVVELVFEAGVDWLPAGVRSAQAPASTGGKRMIFDAGDYRVHVKIELPNTNEPGEIVGEITNRLEPADLLEGTLVQALSAGRTISETTANRFGEFVVDYPFLEDTTLRLVLKERGVRIDLSLDRESRPQSGEVESQR